MKEREIKPESLGLPIRPFLYTLDQIATLVAVRETDLKYYIFYEGRSIGAPPKDFMRAINIALDGKHPQWRVAEQELCRWLKFKGFRVYDKSYIQR